MFEEVTNLWKNRFNEFSNEELKTLMNEGIIVQNQEQDKLAKEKLLSVIHNQVGDTISLLYLIPAGGCNLACKYCFIGKIEHKKIQFMSTETAKTAVQKFAEYLKEKNAKEGTVLFYGGEPTLNFRVIKEIVNFSKDLPVKIKYSIITNGTLLTDEQIDFFKENHFQLSVSLDGPKENTDAFRIFRNTNGSVYDLVIKNLNRLKKKNIDVSLSVTLADSLLNKKTLVNWLKKTSISGVGFNPMIFDDKNKDWKTYYKKISKLLFYLRDRLENKDIFDERLQRKYNAFASPTFKYSDCPARGAEQITVIPNGDITVCHGYWDKPQEEICGNININTFSEIIASPNYQKWKTNISVNKKECLECPAIKICGGGCALQSHNLFDSQKAIDKANCIYNKNVLKELLKRSLNGE